MTPPESAPGRSTGRAENPSRSGWAAFRPQGGAAPARKKICLSLSGGGLSGAFYEIGCLAGLDGFLGFDFSSTRFDIYIGVSAGATISALLAQGSHDRKVYRGRLTDAD